MCDTICRDLSHAYLMLRFVDNNFQRLLKTLRAIPQIGK
jgi:hypothetical protein